jgi:putative ABC transport system ATP-binding protein
MRANVVRLEGVGKDYRMGERMVTALHDIDLSIDEGAYLALAGPSGSGKSTLLNLIGCIDVPTRGRLWINDEDVSGKTPDQLADLRAHTIGFIFQTFNLLPVLSAEENVEYPLLQRRDVSSHERRKRVRYYLEMVGLTAHATHRPNQLSGGQRQRVAIARALAVHPKIILADEPTANLDHKTGRRILKLMRRINRETNVTFIFSTHDPQVIDMAERRVDLEDGEIVRLGVREDENWKYALGVTRAPRDPDTHFDRSARMYPSRRATDQSQLEPDES